MRLLEPNIAPPDSFGAHIRLRGIPKQHESHHIATTDELANILLPNLISHSYKILQAPSVEMTSFLNYPHPEDERYTIGQLVRSTLSDIQGPDHKGFIFPIVTYDHTEPILVPYRVTAEPKPNLLDAVYFGFYVNPYAPEAHSVLEFGHVPSDGLMQYAFGVFAKTQLMVFEARGKKPDTVYSRALLQL